MAEIEGPHWKALQLKFLNNEGERKEDPYGYVCSFAWFYREQLGLETDPELQRWCWDHQTTIYGDWGWNRYAVIEGFIIFIDDFANVDNQQKARDLGFDLK
ncbi:MAG: hypothetical protein WC824_13220 [Bacteroidota bacterium]